MFVHIQPLSSDQLHCITFRCEFGHQMMIENSGVRSQQCYSHYCALHVGSGKEMSAFTGIKKEKSGLLCECLVSGALH